MPMRGLFFWGLLPAAVSTAAPANPALERAAAWSQSAQEAASDGGSRAAALAAFESLSSPALPVVAGLPGSPAPRPSPQTGPTKPAPPPRPSLADRRRELEKRRAPGRLLKGIGRGILGFIAGAVLGGLVGAGLAVAFLVKAPNPELKILKWPLLPVAAALGLAAGAIAGPFVGAWLLATGDSYDG